MVTEKEIRKALRGVKDPEVGLDLVVLGLIYDIEIDGGHVDVTMSLTSPMCPVAPQIVEQAKAAVEAVEGVDSANVDLTFDPLWSPDRIDPIIRATLGI
ncbi:MAG TPA: metal-sulfur cluster assembly factor [Longimicrobiales bacterium]|nr:metal-sulfur cluster assembly factor [Longimicrobiales bacterium]